MLIILWRRRLGCDSIQFGLNHEGHEGHEEEEKEEEGDCGLAVAVWGLKEEEAPPRRTRRTRRDPLRKSLTSSGVVGCGTRRNELKRKPPAGTSKPTGK